VNLSEKFQKYWTKVNQGINSKVPKKILYEELSESIELPRYQAFCKYIKNNIKEDLTTKVVVKIERMPGDSIEVDYSGDSVQILSPSTDELIRVELFVGCLSYSGFMFAKFTASQKLEDFIDSHNNMFQFFGGVTRYIIPDNSKTAVTKTDKYDPLVNRT
jgi:transposase